MGAAGGKGEGPSSVHRRKVSLACSDLGSHAGKNPAVVTAGSCDNIS